MTSTACDDQNKPDPNSVAKLTIMFFHDDGDLFSIHLEGHHSNPTFIAAVLADGAATELFIERGYSKTLGGIKVIETDKILDDIDRSYLRKLSEEEIAENYEEGDTVYDFADKTEDGAFPITGVAFEPT